MVAIWYNHHHSWRITLFSGNLSTRYFFYTIKNTRLPILIDIILIYWHVLCSRLPLPRQKTRDVLWKSSDFST